MNESAITIGQITTNTRSGRVLPVKPKACGISIHHCLALHSSGPNPSGAPRRGIVFQYRADDAFQLADGVWKDTGIMICRRVAPAQIAALSRALFRTRLALGRLFRHRGQSQQRLSVD